MQKTVRVARITFMKHLFKFSAILFYVGSCSALDSGDDLDAAACIDSDDNESCTVARQALVQPTPS